MFNFDSCWGSKASETGGVPECYLGTEGFGNEEEGPAFSFGWIDFWAPGR